MLNNLKQKLNETLSDEFKRQHLSEQIQLVAVALFWVGLFAALMIYSVKHPLPADLKNQMPRASMQKL